MVTDNIALQRAIAKAIAKEDGEKIEPSVKITYIAKMRIGVKLHKLETTDLDAFKREVRSLRRFFPKLPIHCFELKEMK